ncbi:DUF2125 domain-containing protein [Loktanella agnita]|uniref:DUF2125 domain-containing protein n=1 Tax=Loktanella agnita TaxID=287097 RepID=UPI00398843EB
MRKLTILIVVLAALYGGYWFVGARAVETGLRDGLADMARSGWQVGYRDLNTVGFPSRFDTTVDELALTTPDRRFSFAGPFLQVFALSYQPNRIIAVLPEAFDLAVDGQAIAVENADLRLSAGVQANTDVALDAVTVDTHALKVDVQGAGQIGVDHLLAALRDTPDAANRYDIYLGVDEFSLPEQVLRALDPDDRLSGTITRITLDAGVTLDKQLDRHALDARLPAPVVEQVNLKTLAIDWDGISVVASGEITLDALGIPGGQITFKTAEWREIIDLLQRAGVIDAGLAPTLTNAVRAIAAGDDQLELPVSFQNGFMSVGPLPIGPAPRFR